uniref:Major facilitator superfamily (MFS) profile domain-containing protein n=1 Tax=Trichogramma kaykai TaxID=54128 RepID=A0ABD2VU16_9HYME
MAKPAAAAPAAVADQGRSDNNCCVEKKTFWSQHLASVTLSLIMFLVGLANGWSSPYLAKLSLQESTDGIAKLTSEQLTWLASLMNIARIFGACAGAVAQDTAGRKMSLCFAGLPMLGGWLCVATASRVEWLYAARACCGFAMGMIWTTLSLYLAEIADPEIRGLLPLCTPLSNNEQVLWNISAQSIGLFLGNLMGPYISMKIFGYVAIGFNLLFLLLFPLVPDSPYRYITIGRLDKAEASLAWLRRRADVKAELQQLQDYVESSRVSLLERMREFKDPIYMKSFLMMFMINIFSYFGAYNVTNNYMEIIITSSRVTIEASTIVTSIQGCSIVSGLLATFRVDRYGRRFLLIASSLGMALSLTSLGVHFLLLRRFDFDPARLTWLPCLCLLCYSMSYTAGCGCIPSALVGELFSPRLKTLASLVFSATSAVFSSLSTMTFLPFLELVGPAALFWFYSAGIYASIVYYYYYVPETMGKSLQDIQKEPDK